MQDSQILEILIPALVAGFVLVRLYTVLGRRTGHEPPPREGFGFGGSAEAAAKENPLRVPAAAAVQQLAERPSDPVAQGLYDIGQADREFDADYFVAGARTAYETIVTAFARGDRATLKPLLGAEVFAAFDQAIGARESRRERTDFTFVGFKEIKIVHAALKNRMAEMSLSIAAQFISATFAAAGTLIEGDAKSVRDVTDLWTFARDIRSRDPNWLLVATQGAQG